MSIESIFIIWLALMGLAIGSFLNVVIYRLPRNQSLVHPRSRCTQCGYQLTWYDNIPVFSWLALRGKCRKCATPISPRYALVELLTGFLFLASWVTFGWTWNLVIAIVFISLLLPLFFIDAELWLLPFELTLPGIALGILLKLPIGLDAVIEAVVGAVACFLLFRFAEWLGWLIMHKEALGAGDKFLLAMVGAFLGPRSILGVIFLASLQGAIYGITNLVVRGRAGPEYKKDDPAPAVATGPDGAPVPPEGTEPPPEPELTFTPDYKKPGLAWWQRVLYVPWTIFLQPIPDDPPVPEGTTRAEDDDGWRPGATSLPFGPWIVLAALEIMLLGAPAAAAARNSLLYPVIKLMSGA